MYTEWPEQGVPKAGEGFIDFIGQVHKTKEGFGQEGPIVVHCSAGKSFKNFHRLNKEFRRGTNGCFSHIKYCIGTNKI